MAIQKNRNNQQACTKSDDLQHLLDQLPGAMEVVISATAKKLQQGSLVATLS